MKRVMIVFGTRPEAIKLAPVIREIQKRSPQMQTVLVVTAQHREMLDQVLRLFCIQPDYDLDIMSPGQTPFEVTNRTLSGLKPLLESERPDVVLVQGDTTTVLAASLAAFYAQVPIGHVEAGLRTYDKYRPFPEEMNRRLVSHLADWHFAPTEQARRNLLQEGIRDSQIVVTGNTVIDALLSVVKSDYAFAHPILSQIDYRRRVILATAHRRENWGEPIRRVCMAIRDIVSHYADALVVFSVHLNPEVQRTVRAELAGVERVHLVEPLDYEPFVQLMNRSFLILTDSGGIQEEAPSLGKPVLVLREVTERPEAVQAGTVSIVGTDAQRILDETSRLMDDPDAYRQMSRAINPYGDGHAAERIARTLQDRGIS